MAAMGAMIVGQIKGENKAEKAFLPLWLQFQEALEYGLVTLGLIAFPFTVGSSFPMDCQVCKEHNCEGVDPSSHKGDQGYSAWWAKKYCTFKELNFFILYYPYFLIITALIMVAIGQLCKKAFNTGPYLDRFYDLLVKDIEHDEDKADGRSIIEAFNGFSTRSNFHSLYVMRSVVDLIGAGLLIAGLVMGGLSILELDEHGPGIIRCDVYGTIYECAGLQKTIMKLVMLLALVFLGCHVICTMKNILWVSMRRMGKLSSFMKKYRLYHADKKEVLGDLDDIYYGNKDLNLLLNLLAESSGVASSLKVLALFDNNFRSQMQANNLQLVCSEQYNGAYDVTVEFGDASAIKKVIQHLDEVSHIYTVEITPTTDKSNLESIKIGADGQADYALSIQVTSDGEEEPLKDNARVKDGRMSILLRELKAGTDYSITVSTILNHHTVARVTEKVSVAKLTGEEE